MRPSHGFCVYLLMMAVLGSEAQTGAPPSKLLVSNQSASLRVEKTVVGAMAWDASQPGGELASSPSKQEVNKFVLSYLNARPDEAKVCSSAFVNITKTRNVQLLVSLDFSGRHFCNTILIMQKRTGGFESQTLESWEVDDVKGLATDVDSGQGKALQVSQPISQYNGAGCVATWIHLYELRDNALVDVSAAHPEFYEKQLDQLRTSKQDESVCIQMEIDKAERFLRISPDAGLSRAKEWMRSPEISLRLDAIAVLADIGSAQAVELLRSASRDSNATISAEAKYYLTKLTHR